MEQRDGAKMLAEHLTKSLFQAAPDDNLMSWTSSLLFAIQYAIFRARTGGRSYSDVWICAVDTTRFPTGQFASAMWLIENYRTAEIDRAWQEFF